MKILIISDAFWPDHTGGITKSLLTEVEGLVARGHQIVVVTRHQKKKSAYHETRNGYEVYRYLAPSKGSVFYRTWPLFTLAQLPRLVKKLQACSFDVVYVHNPFQMLGLRSVPSSVPLVYTFYAPRLIEIEVDARRGKYGLLTLFLGAVKPFIRMAERQSLRQANVILVRSQFMIGQMQRLCGNGEHGRITLVPLGVDTISFGFANDVKTAREALGLSTDRSILLTVRRLVGRMGLENLIDAMVLVVSQHPQVLLLIGGKGYLEDELREQVRRRGLERHVRLMGFIPEEKLPAYYQAADLFVLPTAALEGFGLATIEALSCGTPVIATPVGANPEVIGPLGSEFLCKDATAQALAERINWWLDRGVPAETRQACREYCVSRFAVESVVTFLEDIFAKAKVAER